MIIRIIQAMIIGGALAVLVVLVYAVMWIIGVVV